MKEKKDIPFTQLCTVDELKRQLNIEKDWKDDDPLLQTLLSTAQDAVFNYLNRTIDDFPKPIPHPIRYAILILASTYFSNRELMSYGNAIELNYSFAFLLSPYKRIIIK